MFKVRWGLPLLLVAVALASWLFVLNTEGDDVDCRPIVEVVQSDRDPSLECVEALPAVCARAGLGDRVLILEDSCQVERDGMSAPSRLVLGLPLLLNRVSVQELQLLRGVGEKTAKAIIERRQALGGFQSVDDLLEVDGIGEKRLETFRRVLKVSNSRENRSKGLDSSTDGD